MKKNLNNIAVDFLFFSDCPSWEKALKDIQFILQELNINLIINMIRVETHEEAIKHRFVGSPSIRINGKNIFPTDHNNYALGCRIYKTPEGLAGSPTREMIREKLSNLL